MNLAESTDDPKISGSRAIASRQEVERRRAARNLPPEVRQVIAVMAEIAIRERRRVRAAGADQVESR